MTFDQIISTLPPNIQTILRQLAQGTTPLSARELLRLLAFLMASGAAYKDTIWAALIWLANAGKLEVPTLVEAATLMAEGEGASVVAAGGAEAGAGALSGAALAATVLSILAALLAAAFAVYMIYTEVKTEVRPVKGGIPCKVASGPAGTVLTLWRSRIGSRTSYNAALRAVEEEAARLVTCSGNCRAGRCQPVPIVISAIPKYRVFWTTTVVTYMVGCACI